MSLYILCVYVGQPGKAKINDPDRVLERRRDRWYIIDWRKINGKVGLSFNGNFNLVFYIYFYSLVCTQHMKFSLMEITKHLLWTFSEFETGWRLYSTFPRRRLGQFIFKKRKKKLVHSSFIDFFFFFFYFLRRLALLRNLLLWTGRLNVTKLIQSSARQWHFARLRAPSSN